MGEEPIVQLNSWQLILAISAFLLFGLFFFLLGNWTRGRYDEARAIPADALTVPAPEKETDRTTVDAPRQSRGEGRQVSPRSGLLIQDRPVSKDPVRISAPPPNRGAAPDATPRELPRRPSLPPGPATLAVQSDNGGVASDEAETAATEPPTPAQTASVVETPGPQSATLALSDSGAGSAPVSKGEHYTVQVIAFGAEHRKKADEYVSLIRTNTNYTADIVQSEDGKHLRVNIGRYESKAEAEKIQAELRKRKAFADCIVKKVS